MAQEASYNGWSNYETWNLALWIDNDQGSQEYWMEQAQECWTDAMPQWDWQSKEDAAISELADRLEADIKDNAPELSGFYGDVLTAAIQQVNWREIARHWIEEVDKEQEEAEA